MANYNYDDNGNDVTPWWDLGHQLQRAGYQGSRLVNFVGSSGVEAPQFGINHPAQRNWGPNDSYDMWGVPKALPAPVRPSPGIVVPAAPPQSVTHTVGPPVGAAAFAQVASPAADPVGMLRGTTNDQAANARSNEAFRQQLIQRVQNRANPYGMNNPLLADQIQRSNNALTYQNNPVAASIHGDYAAHGFGGGAGEAAAQGAARGNYAAAMDTAAGQLRDKWYQSGVGFANDTNTLLQQLSNQDLGGTQLAGLNDRLQQMNTTDADRYQQNQHFAASDSNDKARLALEGRAIDSQNAGNVANAVVSGAYNAMKLPGVSDAVGNAVKNITGQSGANPDTDPGHTAPDNSTQPPYATWTPPGWQPPANQGGYSLQAVQPHPLQTGVMPTPRYGSQHWPTYGGVY